MDRTKQNAWSKPQHAVRRGLGQWCAEYALIIAFVTTMLASATITVDNQLSSALASVATALLP